MDFRRRRRRQDFAEGCRPPHQSSLRDFRCLLRCFPDHQRHHVDPAELYRPI